VISLLFLRTDERRGPCWSCNHEARVTRRHQRLNGPGRLTPEPSPFSKMKIDCGSLGSESRSGQLDLAGDGELFGAGVDMLRA
jgi:hypothetical protein